MKKKKQLRTLIKVKLKKGSMKKLLYCAITLFVASSCSDGGRGEVDWSCGQTNLVSVQIHMVCCIYQQAAILWGKVIKTFRLFSILGRKLFLFKHSYIDQTEISNNEYRQFVYWVRDSIARRILGEEAPDEFLTVTSR